MCTQFSEYWWWASRGFVIFSSKKKKNLCTLNSTLYLTKIHDGRVNTYVEHIQGGRVGGTPPPLVQGVLAPSWGRDTQASTPQAHDGPGASSAACPVLVTTPHPVAGLPDVVEGVYTQVSRPLWPQVQQEISAGPLTRFPPKSERRAEE